MRRLVSTVFLFSPTRRRQTRCALVTGVQTWALPIFSRAAEEPGVTHGAVSRHVQTLEQFLGAALFRPQGRGRVPTERAAVYLAEVSAALDRLGSATERMREPAKIGRAHV